MGRQSIIDVDQFGAGADGGDLGTGIDAHLIHVADIDHQSGSGRPSGIAVTARPQVNRDIAAAGKINTRNNIAGRPAARHGARTNVVEACVKKFSIVFECGVFRKQKAPVQTTLKAGPFCGAVLRSAGRKPGRRQTA